MIENALTFLTALTFLFCLVICAGVLYAILIFVGYVFVAIWEFFSDLF